MYYVVLNNFNGEPASPDSDSFDFEFDKNELDPLLEFFAEPISTSGWSLAKFKRVIWGEIQDLICRVRDYKKPAKAYFLYEMKARGVFILMRWDLKQIYFSKSEKKETLTPEFLRDFIEFLDKKYSEE